MVKLSYKFYTKESDLEIALFNEEVMFEVSDENTSHSVFLDKDGLFELVGCLLSLQAKLKKGGIKNG